MQQLSSGKATTAEVGEYQAPGTECHTAGIRYRAASVEYRASISDGG